MQFSRNSDGTIEAYTDDGIFVGFIETQGSERDDEIIEDGGEGSGNFGHAGRPGEIGGSSSGPKALRHKKDPEQLIRPGSYMNSFDYRFAAKQSRSARERRDEAWKQYKESDGPDKGAALKEFRKYDKLTERYDDEIDALRKKAAYEQLSAWEHTPPQKTDRTNFEGFTTETTGTTWGDEQLKNPGNYIAVMSPEEYLKRCAYDIFEETTLENQVRCGDPEAIDKYAERMENGEKYDLPYLDYRTNNQEGRHRAMAAMKAGILRMPVLIVGYNQKLAEQYRNKRLENLKPKEPDLDIPDDVLLNDEFVESEHPRENNGRFTSNGGSAGGKEAQISVLKEQLKGISRFGAGAQKRAEIQKQIEALEGPKETRPITKNKPGYKPTFPQPDRGHPVTPEKEKQFDIIQRTNPMHDDQHTGIRKPSDIMSPEEAFTPSSLSTFAYPDFTEADGRKALKTGRITVYSSYPIKNGGFVSPSKMMASDYSGGGKVYSATIPVGAVAWINSDEGQMADITKDANPKVRDAFNRIMINAMRGK